MRMWRRGDYIFSRNQSKRFSSVLFEIPSFVLDNSCSFSNEAYRSPTIAPLTSSIIAFNSGDVVEISTDSINACRDLTSTVYDTTRLVVRN